MRYLISVVIAAIVPLVTMTSEMRWFFTGDNNRDLELELLKRIEIERIKSRIQEELGIELSSEIPEFSSPLSDESPLSDNVIQLLLTENEPPTKKKNNLASLILFPTNSSSLCQLFNNTSSCRRFEFSISQNVIYSTSVFWVYKLNAIPFNKVTVSALCSHPNEDPQLIDHYEMPEEDDTEEWLSYHLPMLRKLKFWEKDFTCAIEVTGMVIDEGSQPFLKMVQDQDFHSHTRNRRSENNSFDVGKNCETVPFTVSFDSMGFKNYVIYPKTYDAQICKGYCLGSSNFYETLVELTFEKNKTLEEEYGRCWSMCCRPKNYEDLRLFYREKRNNTEYVMDITMQNMIVSSCKCG